MFYLAHFHLKPILPKYALQSLQGHLSVIQNFAFSLNIPTEFALIMSLGINSHILGANEDDYAFCSEVHCTVFPAL